MLNIHAASEARILGLRCSTWVFICSCLDRAQGGTLIFSYIRRLGSFFLVQNFEFHYFFDFQKNEYFLGMNILWIFLRGHHKIGLYLRVISILRSRFRMGDIFMGW